MSQLVLKTLTANYKSIGVESGKNQPTLNFDTIFMKKVAPHSSYFVFKSFLVCFS